MSHDLVIWLIGGGLALVIAACVLLPRAWKGEQLERRLKSIRYGDVVAEARVDTAASPLLNFVGLVGGLLGRTRFVQDGMGVGMRATLFQAGFRGESAFALFLGAKFLLFVGLPLLAYLLVPSDVSSSTRNIIMLAASVIGLMAPEFFVKRLRGTYLKAVENGLADALDLMVICVESGLGLEPAIERVGQEIATAHPQVAIEFELTTKELRVVADRRTAILNLGLRTGLEPLKRLGTTLAQTLQYGTPLGGALRVLSTEMRAETITRFEAKAARLPVMLTVPMILFILPCIFLVVGGPALVQVLAMMHQ